MLEIVNGFVSCAIFLIAAYAFGVIIFIDKKSKKKSTLHYIVSFALSIAIYTFILILFKGIAKTILHCIVIMFIFRCVFNTNYSKSLVSSVIYSIFTMVSDLLTLGLVTKVLKISKEFCHTHIAGGIISNVCVTTITILLIYLLRKPLKKLLNYSVSTNKKIMLVSLLTLTSIAIFFYSLISTFRLNNNILGYLIVITTLILILFYLFKQKIDNDMISKKYDELLNVMKTYEEDIEEQRTMIHETRNELMTIKCKIKDKSKIDEVISYIDSLLGDKTSSNVSKYSKFRYLPSNGIKGFFYYKFMVAEKRNIKVSVNISKKIEQSFLGELDAKEFKDLVRMIGVYLDNAIEASSESNDKKLGIEIYIIKKDIEIIISNTFENKLNIEKLGKEKFTTKGKNHGHGLLLVKHILRNNSIFEAKNEIIGNLYVQKLKIKKDK